MSRPLNFQLNENAQKEAVISSLKRELYELKDRQHEYIPLENQVTSIQSKYEMLQDEKERIENQHKIKLEMNRNNIVEIRLESDSLKMQIHKSSVAIEEILRDIAGIKRVCENRENQISNLMANNQDLTSKNDFLSEQNRNKANKIKNSKEERNKLDTESERYVKTLQENIILLKNLQKQARALETSNNKLNNILSIAESDHSDLIQEMNNRSDVVNQTHKKLESLNQEIQSLRDKTKKLEKERQKNQEDYKSISASLQQITNKNSEQAKRIKAGQNELRSIQNELDRSILEHDSLEKDYDLITCQNKELHDQINKMSLQIADFERKNVELKIELENYIRYDEQARKLLNRKENMLNLLQTVEKSLIVTESSIKHLK